MTGLKELLTGGTSGATFVMAFGLNILGIIIMAQAIALYRDVYSKRTPVHFNLIFFLQDSFRRLTLSLSISYLFIRFGVVLVDLLGWDPKFLESNYALFSNVLIGGGIDFGLKKFFTWYNKKQNEK